MNIFECTGFELKECPVCGHHFISFGAFDGHCSAECLLTSYNRAFDALTAAPCENPCPDSTVCNDEPSDDSTVCNDEPMDDSTVCNDAPKGHCLNCGEEFFKNCSTHIFCSDACRVKYNNKQRTIKKN